VAASRCTGASDTPTTIDRGDLARWIADDSEGCSRYLFGLAGGPGSGKSTIAARLADELDGIVVPMDGFHLSNAALDALDLRAFKGSVETFDADGFVLLIERLRENSGDVLVPSFDRRADTTVADAICVGHDERIIIVEGNYLLLDRDPWASLRRLFDRTGYLDIGDDTRVRRLVRRHVRSGRSVEEAREFVRTSDERNARLIAAGRDRADLVIAPSPD
jgi:pantothenate kinase